MTFIRQLAMFRHEDGSTQALLVSDSSAKPPVESDWFDEVRIKTASLLGRDVAEGTRTWSSFRSRAADLNGDGGVDPADGLGERPPGKSTRSKAR